MYVKVRNCGPERGEKEGYCARVYRRKPKSKAYVYLCGPERESVAAAEADAIFLNTHNDIESTKLAQQQLIAEAATKKDGLNVSLLGVMSQSLQRTGESTPAAPPLLALGKKPVTPPSHIPTRLLPDRYQDLSILLEDWEFQGYEERCSWCGETTSEGYRDH